MSTFNPEDYGEKLAGFFNEAYLMPLAEGTPAKEMESKLRSLNIADALKPHSIQDRNMAEACESGLWLYHNFLEESHIISQDISTSTGSYWHGIMHRREPDYPNAKYWFRQTGQHPIFPKLCEEAVRLARENNAEILTELETWDPFVFVDYCEQAARGKSEWVSLCRQIQQREWELLFDFCYRAAVGTGQ